MALDNIALANQEFFARQKREAEAEALPILLARLEETKRLIVRAGGSFPDFAAVCVNAPEALAVLRASDKVLLKLRPASRYARLWGDIETQRNRNFQTIEDCLGN